jgi:2-(1,2-epoxy-1,2-dihydrophenyl)acetyl-CoA isomerase
MTPSPVTLDIADGVARIGLARPERGNAVDLDLARALRNAVSEIGTAADIGAVVLYGEGDSFCVGGDLRAFAAAPDPGGFIAELAETAHDAILGLRALRPPVISAIHGACAGAGLGFALAADLVLADRGARFRSAYTAAGLSPDCGVSWALTRLLGSARAADLILTNRQVDAEEALRMGLASRIVEHGTLLPTALDLARSLADGPRYALARATGLIRAATTTALEEHLKLEASAISEAITTPDGAEGITAFLEKRRPQFTAARDRIAEQPYP